MEMKQETYGGVVVRSFGQEIAGIREFAQGTYSYMGGTLTTGESLPVPALGSATILIHDLTPGTQLVVAGVDRPIQSLDVITAEETPLHLAVVNGSATILVAGTSASWGRGTQLLHRRVGELKKVTKPWGYELWLNDEHPRYAFKRIFIKSGTKTSLQYHVMKQETNLLLSGSAILHYKHTQAVANCDVTVGDIAQAAVSAVSALDIMPETVHRLEAVSDVLLCEVSTPHLDDVIRLQDDANRSSGRVESEHEQR